MNITKKKQTHRYRKQSSGYQWGEGRGAWANNDLLTKIPRHFNREHTLKFQEMISRKIKVHDPVGSKCKD